MKSFKQHSSIEDHPKDKIRDYTKEEFPWEHREYTKYASKRFPNAFKDADHFKKEYDKAPLEHLSHHEIKHLEYSTASGYLHNAPINRKMSDAHGEFGHRRDVDKIAQGITHDKIPPPIVLKHSKGMRILGGNTRLAVGLANNKNLPVKIIDISDRH
jgi:hypothetical protein